MADSQNEKRKYARRKLIYYLKVFDKKNSEQIGNLVDITSAGMMLISEDAIPTGRLFEFKIELPQKMDGTESIDVQAQSMWSKNDINPVLFDSGFQFKELSSEAKTIIQTLIDQISFEND